jgi:hypothetical protein
MKYKYLFEKLNKIICAIFGHKFITNYPSKLPKKMCKRCKEKYQLNILGKRDKVVEFTNYTKTDYWIIKNWK